MASTSSPGITEINGNLLQKMDSKIFIGIPLIGAPN
jgi:hypothetical protein